MYIIFPVRRLTWSVLADIDTQDGSVWGYHHSAEVALKRISSMVQPFTGRHRDYPEKPHFDTDLYLVHNLILASTIHLHLENMMNPQISWAAKRLAELVTQLTEEDYEYLDPTLAVSDLNLSQRMIGC